MEPTIDVAVLPAVVIVLVFGVLVAPTAFGHGVADVVGQLAQGVTQADGP